MSFPSNTLITDMVTRTPWGERRNRFYWDASVGPTGLTQLEAICDRVLAVIGTNYITLLSAQCQIMRFEGRFYGAGSTEFEANSTSAPLDGARVAVIPNSGTDAIESTLADTLPDEVCLIVQKRTGNIGRSKRGRWFFTGLSEQIQNAGEVDAAVRASVKVFADTLSNDITVSSGFSTVLHARHYDKLNHALLPITKCYAIRTMGTRRDRRRPLRLSRL